ncbi:cytochrome c oxidase accessory protein CcoG [Methylotenera mobilis]|uniref:Cytochrome c oxidase accessory protein CcoG n=1 Tax=Methylotenera mobilis (strain JLW8 / ATCC BAA-1282 / DSM 17540) TaxID=583345 RepID=C6WWP6_METML|nr:cytochrome c oxidase accessory protein CcoG [Methylotenera mobilis]ACT48345.1 cytochrome c oxidase accessory protein CcoG [Methylotenera mobilis JLW8]
MKDAKTTSKKIIPIAPAPGGFMPMYEAQAKIYPRNTAGFFKNWRWVMIWITQIVFYGVPWLQWGERQAMLLDISTHRFYIFGLVLYPQDLIYLVIILIIAALALFLFTAVAGRLWCGFSCPQSVYTEIFLWMERKIEGDRAARMRLDESKFGVKKLYIKSMKHFAWISFSIFTGFTFLGYFSPIRDLLHSILEIKLSPWETFWICFYGLATYGNAGFLREQVCKHMCPYARFQSAMFDNDTLIVTYDQERGEPRSGRSRKVDAKQEGLGDCIDCNFCVQVCPVGIDIRNGLQYECISCGLCVDACNSIMDKMNYSRGLIRFTTQNGLAQHWTKHQVIQKILRPRVLIYSALLLLLSLGLVASLALRPSFKVDVNRDRGVMSRLVSGGKVENVYQLQITNVTEAAESYRVSVTGIDGLSMASQTQFTVEPANERLVAVSLQIADGAIRSGTHPIMFEVEALGSKERITQKSIFYMSR